MENEQNCELCERSLTLTEHHLIPREMHNKSWCKKKFTLEERKNNKINICHDCHDAIHRFVDNKTLAKEYNTLDKLKNHDKIIAFINWVSKSPNRKFKT